MATFLYDNHSYIISSIIPKAEHTNRNASPNPTNSNDIIVSVTVLKMKKKHITGIVKYITEEL